MKLINYIHSLGSKLSNSKSINKGFSSIEEELFQILPSLKRFGILHENKLITVSSSLTLKPLQNSIYKMTVNECLHELDGTQSIVDLEHTFFKDNDTQAILIKLSHNYKIILERPLDKVNLTPIFELLQGEFNKFILNRSQKKTIKSYSKFIFSAGFIGAFVCLLFFVKLDRTEKAEYKYVPFEKRGIYSLQEKSITEIHVKDGALVKKGDVLVVQKEEEYLLSISNYESKIEELFIAQKEAEFSKEIAQAKIISLQIEQARINKKDAERKLQECTLTASASGTIIFLIPETELINSIHQRGTLLFEIYDDQKSILEISLNHQKSSILKLFKKIKYFNYDTPLASKELSFESLSISKTPKYNNDLHNYYFMVESMIEETVPVGTRGKATFIAQEETLYQLLSREIQIKIREYL